MAGIFSEITLEIVEKKGQIAGRFPVSFSPFAKFLRDLSGYLFTEQKTLRTAENAEFFRRDR